MIGFNQVDYTIDEIVIGFNQVDYTIDENTGTVELSVSVRGTGHMGDRCETPECHPDCQNEGVCSAPNTCDCSGTGHMGDRCETPECHPDCQNEGVCSAPNKMAISLRQKLESSLLTP
jgi:hypothetical protein